PYIASVTFPNNKSKHLSGLAMVLVDKFNSVVPDDPAELQKLPGVGRKSANVIASVIFGKPLIAVDTHVYRVSRRLGLSSGKDVLSVEKDLTNNIPEEKRAIAHHWLILHGRYVCLARKPKCTGCGLSAFCKFYNEKEL
ncbi:MAG: endonuclease III, partial [Bacteroidales bacterium]|nr:endonuclease III [Bacteroidales bacterium]